MWVSESASKFLDAYLEGRLTALIIRDLATCLEDLSMHTVGGSNFGERAQDFIEEDWSAAEYNAEDKYIWKKSSDE